MKNCQLAIYSLSWTTTEQKLQTLFSNIGKVVDVTLVKNLQGESVGNAFITMRNNADAKNAIRTFDGKVVDGKTIRVGVSDENSLTKAIISGA